MLAFKRVAGKTEETKRSGPESFLTEFLFYVLIALGVFLLIQQDFSIRAEQHFVFLARSFLDGHTYFSVFPGRWDDASYYGGHYYWPLGPLPALILMPFVALSGLAVQQGYLLFFFNLLNLWLLYRIAFRITGNPRSSMWLGFAYLFCSAYLFIALNSFSWYFAQAIATSFTLLSLHEYCYLRRWWLIGLWTSLAAATRVTLVLSAVFFIGAILLADDERSEKIKKVALFAAPVFSGMILLLAYNYLRFQSIFEFGYSLQVLHNEPAANRGYGLWSFVHFPANLYYLFFKGPDGVFLPGTKVLTYPYMRANGWGMGIMFTSPVFLWILKAPRQEIMVRLSAITSFLLLLACLGYYGIGGRQFGYRYALDFYPFLFVMVTYAARTKFSSSMKIVAASSFLFNWYLISFMQ